MRGFRSWILAFIFLPGVSAWNCAEAATIVGSADTEGHVTPCRSCPSHAGMGGLDRRATLVASLRATDPDLLLVDAGNWLFGPESLASNGKVMVEAYSALHYDVVNLSYADFRMGKEVTLALLKNATFDVLSANLLDESTGRPLFRPFVVKKVAGRRVAFVGVCEPPPAVSILPHLQEQLRGIRIESPATALGHWLPIAKRESEIQILLYHGSPRMLAALLKQSGAGLSAVIVGGARPDELPSSTGPVVAATEQHGKFLLRLDLPDALPGKVTQIPVDSTLRPDREMQERLARFAEARVPIPDPAVTPGGSRAGK